MSHLTKIKCVVKTSAYSSNTTERSVVSSVAKSTCFYYISKIHKCNLTFQPIVSVNETASYLLYGLFSLKCLFTNFAVDGVIRWLGKMANDFHYLDIKISGHFLYDKMMCRTRWKNNVCYVFNTYNTHYSSSCSIYKKRNNNGYGKSTLFYSV